MKPNKFLSHLLATFALFAVMASVPAQGADGKPNILVIWGDDIGQSNISAYTFGNPISAPGANSYAGKSSRSR